MKEQIEVKELPADMGTIAAIEDVCQERGLTQHDGAFQVNHNGHSIIVTAVEEVHDDIADRAFLRRYCRI